MMQNDASMRNSDESRVIEGGHGFLKDRLIQSASVLNINMVHKGSSLAQLILLLNRFYGLCHTPFDLYFHDFP